MPIVTELTGEWRPWFAWRPVETEWGWEWLRLIERRQSVMVYDGRPLVTSSDYRPLHKVVQ